MCDLWPGKRRKEAVLKAKHHDSGIPSGEHTKSHGKSPFLMGKSTISMAIFHCYVSSPEGRPNET